MCYSLQAPAIQFTPMFKAYSTWWSTTSPGCVNKWALCTDLQEESRKTSIKNSLPRLPESWNRQSSHWAHSPTCSWLCRMSLDRWVCAWAFSDFILFPDILSFFFFFLREYQDLLGQLDVVQHREEREDLKLELESLVTRMEEKGAQITKLRKHWQMVSSDEIWSTCTLVFSTTLMLYYTTLIFNTFRVSFTQVVWICHKHICNRSETDFYWSQVHLLSYLM